MSEELPGTAYVDETGHLVLPPEAAARYGFKPGDRLHIDTRANSVRVHRSPTQLAKVYIEPTSRCNLNCRTCIRNVWGEELGMMDGLTFSRVMEGLRGFPLPFTTFFGGFGEPLSHPEIVQMVGQTKALGAVVELITNGTLLDETLSHNLIGAGLDRLWVSFDGATPDNYENVRPGAVLPQVEENVRGFIRARRAFTHKTQIGIAFVAIKRNIADLPALRFLAHRLGATRILVTNLLPHTEEMQTEVLYSNTMIGIGKWSSPLSARLSLPRMDWNADTREPLAAALCAGPGVEWAGADEDRSAGYCPFIESGSTAISWSGSVSPCLPLMHTHSSYLDQHRRCSRRYVIGNVIERSLEELWNDPEYLAFRARVQRFDFSPCTACDSCELAEANEEDCFGNTFPTCGGCLWAQDLIQCP